MNVAAWLRDLGLEQYEPAFRANDIDAEILSELTAEDLVGLGVTSIGHRRRLLKAIGALRHQYAERLPAPASVAAGLSLEEPGAREVVRAERRHLTVMFVDLVGSTELAARLDPEELREVIGAYHKCTAAVIERFEGHVAKYLGDGVLAYLGWPRAHEDDSERAVRAGLELVEAIARLDAHVDVHLQARVGIATGTAVVGDLIGEGASREEAVVGDVPNLAARLQALAEPGSVVISQATRNLLGGLFKLDDLGPQRLKGFAKPIAAWQVAGESGAEGRFEARHATKLTPLVGRDEELSLLLRRWEQVKDGEGQVVLLSGEPGIGKSRLVRELRARVTDQPHLRLSYQCSPYHETSPLHPVIEQLERAAGFERDDPPVVKLDKLEALLARGTEKLDEAVPLVAAVLGVPAGDRYPLPELTAQRQKQRTLEVLVDQLEGLSGAQPVFLVYEDAHWIDPTTRELLDLAIERTQRLPVLMIITFRPEYQPPWTRQPHASSLVLTRLGRRDGRALVERMAGEKMLPAEVRKQIVGKTDGVPLFLEELTKTMLESGLLRDAGDRYELTGPHPPLAIPSTLHDSLLARLDRLAPAKEIAQIGAAIGREFSHALLAAVADRPEQELQAAIDQLVSSELVFRRGFVPEATYSFKHALVQDAAYGTLLRSKRQQLHARIAQVLEEHFPETTASQPQLLGHHCTQAGFVEKAIDYWYRAGRQAMTRSATAEAASQLAQALDLLPGLPVGPDRDSKELDLQIALGAALISNKGWAAPEVGTAYARARELCIGEGRFPHLLGAMSGLHAHHLHRSSKRVALRIAGELLGLGEQRQDTSAQAAGHRFLGVTLLFNGQLLLASKHFEQFLALYDPADRNAPVYLWGPADNRLMCLIFTALILLFQGYPDQALVRSREMLAAAYEAGHSYTTSQALYLICWLHHIRGEQRDVEEQSRALLALATEGGLSAWAANGTVLHGWAVAKRGAAEVGMAELRRGLAASEAMGIQQHTPCFLGLLAELCMGSKNYDEARKLLDEALARVERLEERWFEADLHRLRGEAFLASSADCAGKAESCYRQALAVARSQSARLWELRATVSLAHLWRDQGKRTEARDLLAPVYAWFTEGFDTHDLIKARTLLNELA